MFHYLPSFIPILTACCDIVKIVVTAVVNKIADSTGLTACCIIVEMMMTAVVAKVPILVYHNYILFYCTDSVLYHSGDDDDCCCC